MRVKVEFEGIFHNVGQGLFYSGEIIVKNKNSFNFVYDCGSIWNNGKTNKKHLEPAIERYVSVLNNSDVLHLLVISHLHADHVNGLSLLLKKFKKVKIVVLPYFSPIERLIIALANINASDWYFKFLADPAVFLLNENENKFNVEAEKVVFIVGNGEPPEEPPEEPPTLPREPDDGFPFPIEELPDLRDEELKSLESYSEEYRSRIYHKLAERVYLGYPYCNGESRARAIWEFVFFNYRGQISHNDLNQFERCLRNNLKIQKLGDIKRIIRNIKKNEKIRTKIQKCYLQLAKAGKLGPSSNKGKLLNNTSLVLFHRPLYFKTVYSNSILLNLPFRPYEAIIMGRLRCGEINKILILRVNEIQKFGTLLLGDIDLNKVFKELKNYLKNRLISTHFALIPHHGSKHNWNRSILQEIQEAIWIASAGTYNTYGHPSYKVFKEIIKLGGIPFWCSEINPLVYCFELSYKC